MSFSMQRNVFSEDECLFDMAFDALHVIATFAFITYTHMFLTFFYISHCLLIAFHIEKGTVPEIIIEKLLRQDFDLPRKEKKNVATRQTRMTLKKTTKK